MLLLQAVERMKEMVQARFVFRRRCPSKQQPLGAYSASYGLTFGSMCSCSHGSKCGLFYWESTVCRSLPGLLCCGSVRSHGRGFAVAADKQRAMSEMHKGHGPMQHMQWPPHSCRWSCLDYMSAVFGIGPPAAAGPGGARGAAVHQHQRARGRPGRRSWRPSRPIRPWTPEEKRIFNEKFLAHPKVDDRPGAGAACVSAECRPKSFPFGASFLRY